MREVVSCVFLVGLMSLLLISCEPNASLLEDKPVADAMVNVRMKATTDPFNSGSSSSGRTMLESITFTQASIGVDRLVFQQQDTTASDSTVVDSLDVDTGFHVEGPFIFDLIAGTSTPSFEITPGLYEGVVIKAAPVLPDSSSILVAFGATDGENTLTVEFSSVTERSFGIKSDSAAFQFDGSVSQVLILLQLEALFADIDFSKAVADEDGVIRINESSNIKLYNKINSNLGKAFKASEE